MEYQDITIRCKECMIQFVWEVGEQRFLQSLFEEGKISAVVKPTRCRSCNEKKKARIAESLKHAADHHTKME